MNEDHVKEWTQKLRTTTTPQANGTLARIENDPPEVSMCCLGIAQIECVGTPYTIQETVNDSDGETYVDTYVMIDGQPDVNLPFPSLHAWLGIEFPDQSHHEHSEGDVYIDWPTDLFDRDLTPYAGNLGSARLTCASLNDDCHLTFSQIADVVDYFGVKGTR